MTLQGFKTVAFGALIALTSVASSPEMQAFIAENLPWVGGGLGTAIIVLRALTSSPIFKKKESSE